MIYQVRLNDDTKEVIKNCRVTCDLKSLLVKIH